MRWNLLKKYAIDQPPPNDRHTPTTPGTTSRRIELPQTETTAKADCRNGEETKETTATNFTDPVMTKDEIELIIEQAQAKAFQGYANVFRGDAADCIADMNANAAMIASTKLSEAMAVKWKYPEKAELPESMEKVYFEFAKRVHEGTFRVHTNIKGGEMGMFVSSAGTEIYPEKVRCWCKRVIPQLPQ